MNMRASAPYLIVVLVVARAAGLLAWRLAGFGKEINEVTHRKR